MSVKKVGKTWTFRIDAGTDPRTGKRKQISHGGFNSRKEALEEMMRIQVEIHEGTYQAAGKELACNYFQQWLLSAYKREVQITTYENAVSIVRSHIIPYFGHRILASIVSYELDVFFAEKLGTGLSAAHVRKMHGVLSKAFKKAVQWGLLSKNPMEGTTPPTVRQKRANVWSIEECRIFLDVCEKENELAPFLLAIFTGMRRGEILALNWKNIDLCKGVIHVEQNLGRSVGEGLYLKDVKTRQSNREVFLSPSASEALRKHKEAQQQYAATKPGYKNLGLVVAANNGNFQEPRNLIRKYKSLIEKAGVPYINFHSLRHTHATLLMRMGENPKVVSERLGHSRVGITLDIYSHTNEEMQRTTANRFDEKFWT